MSIESIILEGIHDDIYNELIDPEDIVGGMIGHDDVQPSNDEDNGDIVDDVMGIAPDDSNSDIINSLL